MKTTDLSTIMRMAWQFYRITRRSFSECLKLSWQNFKLVRRMHSEVVRFYFRKVDGTLREAWGTLRSDLIPSVEELPETRKKNNTVQTYFDTEKNEWRCYKRLNITSI